MGEKIGENYFIQKPIKNRDLIRRITGIINKNWWWSWW